MSSTRGLYLKFMKAMLCISIGSLNCKVEVNWRRHVCLKICDSMTLFQNQFISYNDIHIMHNLWCVLFILQVRLQLETLLAEKSCLAQENSNYARENWFLHEVVEYHQLNMQDVIYLDENIEEVIEVGLDLLRGTQKERLPFEK